MSKIDSSAIGRLNYNSGKFMSLLFIIIMHPCNDYCKHNG